MTGDGARLGPFFCTALGKMWVSRVETGEIYFIFVGVGVALLDARGEPGG
jgi:hypothetical protein